MVVDDDAAVREMLVRVMTGDGYAAWPAADGAEALEIAGQRRLDLMLLDLGLPDKAGWDVFESLTLKNPLLAVIVITATPDQVDVARASGAGAFFEKPLDFPTLLATVRRLLAEPAEFRLTRMLGRPAPRHQLKAVHGKPPYGIL
jgi:DNA-binding response OmpR family regulator